MPDSRVDPVFEEAVEKGARALGQFRPTGWRIPILDEERAKAREVLRAAAPVLLGEARKERDEAREMYGVAFAQGAEDAARAEAEKRRADEAEDALRAIRDEDVPGEGDWSDCVIAFARAALSRVQRGAGE